MKFTELSYVSINGRTGSCSRFPGIARLEDGQLVMLYDDGIDPDSPIHEMRIAISRDNARSWEDGGIMYDQADLKLPHRFTENCKPVSIGGTRLVSVGFGFMRDRPEMGLAAYAERFGHFPLSRNTVSHSEDGGIRWALPAFIEHRHDTALELSGPPLWCESEKTLLAFGPPFVLQGQMQRGICLASRDDGRTWCEQGIFFESESVAPWELRAIMSAAGRLWLVMWAYDLKNKVHLPNHLVYSDNLGKSWSKPMNSDIRGQAANLFEIKGQLWLLYTRREGENPGIFCVPVSIDEAAGTLLAGESVALWQAAGMTTPDGRIERQFRNLKFGQPSMTRLGDSGEWLLAYWSCENDGYAIRTRVLRLEE